MQRLPAVSSCSILCIAFKPHKSPQFEPLFVGPWTVPLNWLGNPTFFTSSSQSRPQVPKTGHHNRHNGPSSWCCLGQSPPSPQISRWRLPYLEPWKLLKKYRGQSSQLEFIGNQPQMVVKVDNIQIGYLFSNLFGTIIYRYYQLVAEYHKSMDQSSLFAL